IFDGVDLNYTPAAAGGPVNASFRTQGKSPSDDSVWLYIADSNNETGTQIPGTGGPGVHTGQVTLNADGVQRYLHVAVEAPGTTEPWVASALTAPPGWGFELSDGTRTRTMVTDTDHWQALGGFTFFEDVAGGFDSQAQAPISRGPVGGGAGGGLVAHWPIEAGSGSTMADIGPNGYNGSISGATWVSDPARGTVLDFDGGNDEVTTGVVASTMGIGGNAPKTVSGWVYTRAFDNGGWFDLGRGGPAGAEFCLRTLTSDNRWRAQFWGGPDFDFSTTDIGVTSLNEWVHFALVHDGSQGRAYVNGLLVGSENSTLNVEDDLAFRLGRYRDGNWFDGRVDDVAVWDFAVDPLSIRRLYLGELAPEDIVGAGGGAYPPGTEGIWPADTAGGQSPVALFSAPFTLVEMPTMVEGDPAGTSPTTDPGLNVHLVRRTTAVSDLLEAAVTLTLAPDDPTHRVSGLDVASQAHIEGGGLIGGQVGNFANTPQDDDYAVHMAGYIMVPDLDTDPETPGVQYTHSFQAWSDDGIRMTIGDTTLFETEDWGNHGVVTVTFPDPGLWPIDVLWRERGGGQGLEITARQGPQTTDDWDPFNWDVLGTGDYPVYQRPDAMPDPGLVGANSLSGPVSAAAPIGPGDGLHLQITEEYSGNINNVGQALSYLAGAPPMVYDSTDPGTGDLPVQTFNFRDENNGSTGHFGGTVNFPGEDPGGDTNDFVTHARGFLYIDDPGTYSFAVGSDDGFRLNVGGQNISGDAGNRGHTGSFAWARFTEPGFYPIELIHYERGGGSSLEFSFGGALQGTDPATRSPDVLVSNNNANTQGFGLDFGGRLYSFQPRARLERELLTLKGAAF
ncbi:MAG: LamG-like jellyroll fold domain-containing protein, partial [Candidatus Brocadiia bacterium]